MLEGQILDKVYEVIDDFERWRSVIPDSKQ